MDEIVDIVDEEDKIIGQELKAEIRENTLVVKKG